MKFFLWFCAALVLFVLAARFKPRTPSEPIIPTQLKEAQANPEADQNAPPARSDAQGQADAAGR